jgi:hypothetical protein
VYLYVEADEFFLVHFWKLMTSVLKKLMMRKRRHQCVNQFLSVAKQCGVLIHTTTSLVEFIHATVNRKKLLGTGKFYLKFV